MDTDERFSMWIERLEKSLQLYKSGHIDSLDHNKSSLQLLATVIAEEDENLPDWINKYGDQLESLLGIKQSSLKIHLCRLSFPKLSLIYESLKSEMASLPITNNNVPLQVDTLESDPNNEAFVEQFFNNIENTSTDPIIGLCKLADFCRRIDRTVKLDKQHLDKLISVEEGKYSTSSQDQELRIKKLQYLEGKDERELIKSSTKLLNSELQSQKIALSDAAKEEELARLAYEAAMKKTKHVQCSVDRLGNVLDTMGAQIETTKKINQMQFMLDKFNAEGAKRRIDLFGTIRGDLVSTQEVFFQRSFSTEFPCLLNQVTALFSTSSQPAPAQTNGTECVAVNSGVSDSVSFPFAIRIGLETVKVFRALKEGIVFDVLDNQLGGFEAHLKGLEKSFPANTKPNSSYRQDDTTVILHFSHLCHDTPDDHVEAQSRINTSLKLLERELAQNDSAGATTRSMVLQNCNDIVAPPLWCLSLVHSLQYLNRLWKFSVEAKSEDLFVPLEFDTEWETDEAASSSSADDSDEEYTRRARGGDLELDEHIKKRLGNEASECLSSIFKLDKTEKKLAKLITEKRSDQKRRRRSRVSAASASTHAKRVTTPYGNGVLAENDTGSDSIKVVFEWGAVGYMNKDSVHEVEDNKNESSFFNAILPTDKDKERDSERFLFTDLRLHKLVTRILSHVKVQRAVLEKVGVKDAHMSLWLHGRTSRGLSQSIEKSIRDWLRMYDVEKLKNLLDEFDQKGAQNFHEENALFMSQLQTIKHPNPSSNRAPLFDEKEKVDLVSLRLDAFEYSKKRLLNKSGVPRANNPRRNRKGKADADDFDRVSHPLRPPSSQVITQQHSEKGFPGTAEKLNVVVDPAVAETLRPLVLGLMHTLQLTQLTIANELFRNYQYKTSQSAISAWFRFRSSRESEKELNRYFITWLQHFRKLLSSKDQEKLDFALNSSKSASFSTKSSHVEKKVSLPSHSLLEGLLNNSSVETTQASSGTIKVENEQDLSVDRLVSMDTDEVVVDEIADEVAKELLNMSRMTTDTSNDGEQGAEEEEDNQDDMDLESVAESVKNENDENGQEFLMRMRSTTQRLLAEMERRNISQTFVSREAATLSITITQPELSQYINHRVIPFSQRGKGFLEILEKWMTYSQTQPKREGGGKFGRPRPSKKRKRPEDTIVEKHVEDLANGAESVIDKPVASNMMTKFLFCEVCKEEEDLKACASCPCQYHLSCIENEMNGEDGGWHCSHCVESGAAEGKVLDDSEKVHYCQTPGAWLYFFASKDRMWRKCCVVAAHPGQNHIVLVKCEDDDNDDEQFVWIDAANLQLLKAENSKVKREDGEEDDDEPDYFCRSRNKKVRQSDANADDVQYSIRKRGRPAATKRDTETKTMTTSLSTSSANIGEGMSDTYLGANSLKAALCAAGTCCRAVDIVLSSQNTNAFCAIRPPGHHAGRNGCTMGCLSTGFCLLNNAAIAVTYARVRYGITRIAVVDIDVHFGNGTAEILQHDTDTFFASVHMIYGEKNDGHFESNEVTKDYGFYPANQGATKITDNYVSIGVYPPSKEVNTRTSPKNRNEGEEEGTEVSDSDIASIDTNEPMEAVEVEQSNPANFSGSIGYLNAIKNVIIPKMEAFAPQLLIISAGFDGYFSDPLGGELNLSLQDYVICTKMLMDSMERLASNSNDPFGGRVISLLEGGYDTSSSTLGLAKCVAAHVSTLRQKNVHLSPSVDV